MVNKITKIKQEDWRSMIFLSPEAFLMLYKDLKTRELAKMLKVSSQAIYRLARQLGVKRRDKIK